MAGGSRPKRADEHMTGKSTAEEGQKPRTTVASVEHVGDTDGCRSNAFERALATDRRGHRVTRSTSPCASRQGRIATVYRRAQ
ncbi:hypothetical protein PVK06_018789 [Gossypium arboreum]|uniref:Uncharacterized protein n=1 Tax=Gossypium arboreum TaxID=29729 RepID=A0ABR0PHX7_GOSAR|nr:hypothetical protein PVK06_018789 [Gossypium arboreum]